MKRIIFLPFYLCCLLPVFGQVGINTTDPQADLDINGTVRVRQFANSLNNEIDGMMLVGVDEEGNFVQIEVGENIILEDNVLRVVENKYRITEVNLLSTIVNNLALVILPGEPNDDKKVVKLRNLLGLPGPFSVSGIEAAEDGQIVWIVAYDTNIKLLANDLLSLPQNRIMMNGNLVLQQYDMVQLIYDGTAQRWMVMSKS